MFQKEHRTLKELPSASNSARIKFQIQNPNSQLPTRNQFTSRVPRGEESKLVSRNLYVPDIG